MELLEKHFDIAFTAPGGIKRLRELILTLAMQGKLVPQDPQDQPAIELMKEIEAKKKRLVKEGKIKAGSREDIKGIKPEEVPYELPEGWQWVRMGEIGETNIGLTYTPSNVSDFGTPVLRSNNIQNGKLDLSDLKRVDVEVKESVLVQEGDLLICARNGSKALVGKTALITGLTEKMAFGAFMAIFRSRVNGYLLYFINSPLFRKMIDDVNTMTINQITQGNLKSTIFPLPPLTEQHRIVAKIDQLMARCDELEKLRTEREQKRIDVHTTAVNRLLSAHENNTFIDTWQFITKHFGELYSVKENVAELRKVILQLAVMGKLVPQDPKDRPASEILKEIEVEKKRLVKEGKIKEQRPLLAMKSERMPYELPKGWSWSYLQDLFALVTDGDHQAPPKAVTGIPFLVIGNLNTGRISLDGCRFVPQNYYHSLEWVKKPTINDLLYTVTGSYGIPIYVDVDHEFCVQRHVAILKSVKSTPVYYLTHLLKSAYALKYATSVATGIAQKTVPLSGLRLMPIAVPPKNEQSRIVAQIDKLMAMCDELENQIDASLQKQTTLLSAVMAKV